MAACELLKSRSIPFTCELVGTGPLTGALKERIREAGLLDRVRLLGPLSQEELRGHYQRAMVFALPCVPAADGDRDILPNVLKEAMATGVPVITSRLEGIEELVVDGENGLLVPPGDPETLANRLERLLGDAALREHFSAHGRRTVEQRFDRRTNFTQLKSLLLEAVQNAAAVPARAPAVALQAYDAHCVR
jgi:glycosyltransferase involved in cell wall biosynthesis